MRVLILRFATQTDYKYAVSSGSAEVLTCDYLLYTAGISYTKEYKAKDSRRQLHIIMEIW